MTLSVGSINAVKNPLMEDKNKRSTYKIHDANEDVSFCEQVEGNTLSPTIDDVDREGNKSLRVSSCRQTESNASSYPINDNAKGSSKVSSCGQTTSNAMSPTIDGTSRKGEVSPLEQVRTSSIVYNTEGCVHSEDLHNLYDGVENLQSKDLNLDRSYDETKSKDSGSRAVSYDKPDLDNLQLIGLKGSDGVVSDDKSDIHKCSRAMSDEETVHQYSKMTLRSRIKNINDLTGGNTLISKAPKQ